MLPISLDTGSRQRRFATTCGVAGTPHHQRATKACWWALAGVAALLGSLPAPGISQDSAPSSHMVFDDNFPGDIIVNQVRVPTTGRALYTYYETLGWRGTGAGYAGIQSHPRGPNFIFSIWDHKEHREPIAAIYRGAQTKTERFGGEGTGLKSWNFQLGWKPDVWYTLVARTWPAAKQEPADESSTDFGFWAQAGDSRRWTHLVTMRVAVPDAKFEGRTDAFIEDWLNTGANPRTTHLRAGWKRRIDGSWHPFQTARYSVNAWDLVEGKRSYNFRTQWDGGVSKDEDGPFYFMVAGGKDTKPTSKNPSQHRIPRQEKAPDYPIASVTKLEASLQGKQVNLRWEISKVAAPQFAYQWRIVPTPQSVDGKPEAGPDTGKAAQADAAMRPGETSQVPHARAATKTFPQLVPSQPHMVQLRIKDIFDRWSPWESCPVTPAPR